MKEYYSETTNSKGNLDINQNNKNIKNKINNKYGKINNLILNYLYLILILILIIIIPFSLSFKNE